MHFVVGIKEIYPCSVFVPFPLQYFVHCRSWQVFLVTVPYTDSIERCLWGMLFLQQREQKVPLCQTGEKEKQGSRGGGAAALLPAWSEQKHSLGKRRGRKLKVQERKQGQVRNEQNQYKELGKDICVGGHGSIY